MLSYTFYNEKRGVYSHNDNILIPYKNAKNNIFVDIIENIDNFCDHLTVSCMISCKAQISQGHNNYIDNNYKNWKYFSSDDAKQSYFFKTGKI